jgi:hypothetical protein
MWFLLIYLMLITNLISDRFNVAETLITEDTKRLIRKKKYSSEVFVATYSISKFSQKRLMTIYNIPI